MAVHNSVILGDCQQLIPSIKDGSLYSVITSPPYFHLRTYGSKACQYGDWMGELGHEPTPEMYVEHLVSILELARPKLRDDGALWLNLRDSYAGSGKGGGRGEKSKKQLTNPGSYTGISHHGGGWKHPTIKHKDLIGVPWMVAAALRDAGWYWRQWIPWVKWGGMCESVQDRPGCSLEVILLMSKSSTYYFDMEGARQHLGLARNWRNGDGLLFVEITPRGTRENHTATFPEEFAALCIAASTSHQNCPTCGVPWRRQMERDATKPTFAEWASQRTLVGKYKGSALGSSAGRGGDLARYYLEVHGGKSSSLCDLGFKPSCGCEDNDGSERAVVFDPFAGLGTVPAVAKLMNRDYVAFEVVDEFHAYALRKVEATTERIF